MDFIDDIQNLPDKIKVRISSTKILDGRILFSIKTAFKPSHNIPILWLIMYSDGILLCSTHNNGIYREILLSTINSIRAHSGACDYNIIEIISNNVDEKDFSIRMPDSTDMKTLVQRFRDAGIEVV